MSAIKRRQLLLPLAALVCGLQSGCANPGQPHPPSLRLPQKAEKLSAERVGDHVLVTWTSPAKTTDKDPIRSQITAVICRDVTSQKAGAKEVLCAPVAKTTVAPGAIHTEAVPLDAGAGVPTLLTYHVELENTHGRSAGESAAVFVAGGAAPPSAAALTVMARREGAQVTWAKTSNPAQVRLVRTQIAPVPQPRQAKPGGGPLAFTASPAQAAVANLKTPDGLDRDAGGIIDSTAQDGYTYSYTAERVTTVTLNGHPLEMHSAMSAPVNFTFRDVFPPAAPTGLVSVPGGGFGQTQTIDLSWDANLETDLLGYNVYRKDAATGGDFIRLNSEPAPTSAFRDLTAEPGHAYVYRVTAIDRRNNESVPSGEIREMLRR